MPTPRTGRLALTGLPADRERTISVNPLDVQDRWKPTWLIDLTGAVSTSVSSGTMDVAPFDTDTFDVQGDLQSPVGFFRFSMRDVSDTPEQWEGRILSPPTIERHLSDVFWGTVATTEFGFTLANTDHALDVLFTGDVRGKSVTLHRYDLETHTTVETYSATLSQIQLEPGRVILQAISPDVTKFEQMIPTKVVTAEEFGTQVVDLGAVIPVAFGGKPRIKLPYIRDGVNTNHYDYLVGYGVVKVNRLYRDGPDGTMQIIDPPEYKVWTTLYRGVTVVRFRIRQQNFSNAFHSIYADIFAEDMTNFARVIQEILTNTLWGLGMAVDTASFDTVAAQLDEIGELVCEGAMMEQKQAQDWLKELLIVRGMRLGINDLNQWTLTLDTPKTSIYMDVGDGRGDGPRTILNHQARELPSVRDTIKRYVLKYNFDDATETFKHEQSRIINAQGSEHLLENHFIRNHVTADKVVDFLAKRAKFGQDTCQLTLTQEARGVSEGDLIRATFDPLLYDETLLEVTGVRKSHATVVVDVALYDESIYSYTPGVLPVDTDVNVDELRIPRPGGLEILGPPRQPPRSQDGVVNISRTYFAGGANSAVWVGRDVRFQWHDAVPIPHKGVDEDNLHTLTPLLRDYEVTFYGVLERHPVQPNATEIRGFVMAKGEGLFPLSNNVLPWFRVRVVETFAVDPQLPVYLSQVPVTIQVWTAPVPEIPIPDVEEEMLGVVSLAGSTILNVWVWQIFPEELLFPPRPTL